MPQTADLDSTISALHSGLTSLPLEAAVANIENWQQQLQDVAPEIARTLGELKIALTSGNSSEQIGQLLEQLGTQTSDAGASAGGEAGSKVQQLGQMLNQAGSSF